MYKFSSLLKSSGIAALAIAIAAPAIPATAFAQDRPQRGEWRGGDRGNSERAAPQGRSGGGERASRNESRSQPQPQAQAQPRSQPQAQSQPQARAQAQARPQNDNRGGERGNGGAWNRERTTERGTDRANNGWNGDRGQRDRAQARPAEPVPPAAATPQRQTERAERTTRQTNPYVVQTDGRRRIDTDRTRDWDRDRDRDRNWDRDRNSGNWNGRDRDYRDNNRNRDYRDRDRNGSYRDGYRDARRDYQRWDRQRWRSDRRYDWNNYRYSNRNVFRLGSYYSPYRNYSYRRLSIGFYLDSLFFGSRYWINDPWQYRLPAVYGPYRWVRYYDDVLLVDTYTGEVVDVIYDFFW